MKSLPPLTTTTIGSVPFLDIESTLDQIARTCPVLPAWPQFVRRHPREDMVLQAVDGLPLLEIDEIERRVRVRNENKAEALTRFYEHFLEADLDYFALPEAARSGLDPFLMRAEADPSFGPEFIKAQVIGPVSFGQSVRTQEEVTLLDDPELSDTVVKGLGAKGAWLAARIRRIGRLPVIFFDEPGLTGFGSAFSTLKGEQVTAMLDEAAEIVRTNGEALIGVHVCGNTDWGMLARTALDILNFDAFGFVEHFLLYPREIKAFLDRGGYVAWGIVPTLEYTGRETAEELAARLKQGWKQLARQGLDLDLIRRRALITPSCGVGGIPDKEAREIIDLLPQVARLVQDAD
ncbi:MAG: hypothetical protein V1742_09805 [Pseudomonadota bacterium]